MKLYFDIDTQIDFMFPSGALYVPGAEKLLPAIATLNRAAAAQGARLISTMCAHDEDDAEFKVWPPHCVTGTVGQSKPAALLLENRVTLPKSGAECSLDGAAQIIVEKGELNLFSNPGMDDVLRLIAPTECLVYGVVTEYCVRYCAMGLLDRGYKVSLVEDAIQGIDGAVAGEFLREFSGRGGGMVRANSIG